MAQPPKRKDTDRLDQGPGAPRAPRVQPSKSLPTNEPGGGAAERAALERTIDELERSFRFMGAAHPEHERTKTRLEQLKAMLGRLPA